jgi:hypothetical protein
MSMIGKWKSVGYHSLILSQFFVEKREIISELVNYIFI